MIEIPNHYTYGATDRVLTLPEEKPNRSGLDAVKQSFQASRKDAYAIDEEGRISPFPGYSTMYIDDATVVEELPGECYVFDLKGLGLLRGRDKWISGQRSQPEQGWDTASYTVYTRTPDLLRNGVVHPSISTLWVADHDKQREIGDIHRVELSFKGIIPVDGNPKPYKRQIGVNSATLSTSEPMQAFVRQANGTYFLDTTGRYYNLESPRVQVVDSFLSFSEPPVGSIPGNWVPPSAPEVRQVLTSMAYNDPVVIANILGATDWNINIPNGWVLKSISSDKHATANVWLTTLTAEYIRQSDARV